MVPGSLLKNSRPLRAAGVAKPLDTLGEAQWVLAAWGGWTIDPAFRPLAVVSNLAGMRF